MTMTDAKIESSARDFLDAKKSSMLICREGEVIDIDLSDEEAVVLQNLVDTACRRARGYGTTDACLFYRKIVEARPAAVATATQAA